MNGALARQPPLMVLPESFKDPRSGARPLRRRGHAAPPGSGPATQPCGSCAHAVSVMGGAKSFTKCRLVEARWTKGPASDIRRKDPACRRWAERASATPLDARGNRGSPIEPSDRSQPEARADG